LRSWLIRERELQGRVRLAPTTVGPEDLGGVLDTLSVALGSGGIGVALTHSLSAWLASRRSSVKLTVTSRGRKIVLDTQGVKDVPALMREVLGGDE
jgi:hypothetical protein